MIIFLFLLPFASLLGEIPIFIDERAIPFSVLERPLTEADLVIPTKIDNRFISIEALRKIKGFNVTRFSEADVRAIVFAQNPEELLSVLEIATQNMQGSQIALVVESYYEKMAFTKILFALFFCAMVALMLRPFFGKLIFGFGSILLTLFLGMRIYILGRPPVTNMEESLLFAAWVAAIPLALFGKNPRVLAGVSLFIVLLLSTLLPYPDPLPLYGVAPVLNSNFWLAIHVLMVVASYGILIPLGLLAQLELFRGTVNNFTFLRNGLYFGTILLISGTLLGGAWAAMSWGRFWGWDPKECWAFISALVYLFFIHGYRMGLLGSFGLQMGALIGMLTLSFTWYGVNYILASGLHSYGFREASHLGYWLFLGIEFTIILYLLLTRVLKKEKKSLE